MNRLDPRLPMVFDTRDLGRRPGSMTEQTRTVPAPEDLGTDVIAIAPGRPLELTVRMESVMEGVLVTGSARGAATGACVRCLDPVTEEVEAGFQELFAYADRAAHHHEVVADDEDDEVRVLDGDLIDLEPVIRDAVVPALPFQPVCREDCPGLCPECGAHLAEDPAAPPRRARPQVGGTAEPDQRHPREEELTWLSRSGRRRAPTPVRAVRTGRRRPPRSPRAPSARLPSSRTWRARPAASTPVATTASRSAASTRADPALPRVSSLDDGMRGVE